MTIELAHHRVAKAVFAHRPSAGRAQLVVHVLRRKLDHMLRRNLIARIVEEVLLGAILALGVGLVSAGSLASTDPAAAQALRLAHIADLTLGAFSDVGLNRLTAGMDPGALRLARLYDPAVPRAATPLPLLDFSDAPLQAPPTFKLRDLTPQQAARYNASLPFSLLPNPAAKPFVLRVADPAERAHAALCLAAAVYYEAGSQGEDGQAAVAQVVLNRLRNPLFPKTVCGVVFEGSDLPTGCQFTFACDGALNREPDRQGWARAQRVADDALNGKVMKTVGEATHYHTVWVAPYWAPSLVKLVQIQAHLFYRWNGSLGLPVSFNLSYAGGEGDAWVRAAGKLSKVAKPTPDPVAPAVVPATETIATIAPPRPEVAPVVAVAVVTPTVKLVQSAPEDVRIAPRSMFGAPSDQRQTPRLPMASNW